MATSEKFCLKWNDFQNNVNTAFVDLRKDSDFTDVTLACKDGYQVEAHKVILSASSPFFQNLLKRNKHAHPLIYIRGVKSEDLLAIVDFLYYGEANIYQDNLDTFLNIAEELKLKGLNSEEVGGGERGEYHENSKRQSNKTNVPRTGEQKKNDMFKAEIASPFISQSYSEDLLSSSIAVALPKQEFSGDMKELDEKIETMMVRGQNMIRKTPTEMFSAFVCQVCGKKGRKHHIKDHIEVKHLEGISIPCSLCEKILKSRSGLRHHLRTCQFSRN